MNNVFLIRAARVEDAPEIARVHVEGWRTGYAGIMPEEYLRAKSVEKSRAMWETNLIEKRDLVLVAEKDGRVRGFVSGGKARAELPGIDSEIYAIYVDQEVRGSGAGGALLRTFFEKQVAQGACSCALWVLKENPSRKFYEKMGGALLPSEKPCVFGGKTLVEVSYIWKPLI